MSCNQCKGVLASIAAVALLFASRPALACDEKSQELKISAAYFQTSRWAAGYVASTPEAFGKLQEYKDDGKFRDPYIKAIQTFVQKQDSGLCMNWAGGPFVGVDQADGLTLEWVKKEDQKLNKSGTFLQEEAGGAGEKNGWADPERFMKVMREKLSELGKKPLFAIVDHDNFHNMSAPLVEHALADHAANNVNHGGKTPVKLLVHMDAHDDYVGKPAERIGCHNWIDFILKPGGVATHTVDKVLWVGVKGAESGNLTLNKFAVPGKSYAYFPRGEDRKVKATTIKLQLDELVKKDEEADIYVTVDRDVMQGSFTPWGSGPHSPEVILGVVQDVAAWLREGGRSHSHLIGFDVTGLPAQKATHTVEKMPDTRAPAKIFEQADKDIAAFYKVFVEAQP